MSLQDLLPCSPSSSLPSLPPLPELPPFKDPILSSSLLPPDSVPLPLLPATPCVASSPLELEEVIAESKDPIDNMNPLEQEGPLELVSPLYSSFELAKEFVLQLKILVRKLDSLDRYFQTGDKIEFEVRFLRADSQWITVEEMSRYVSRLDPLIFTDINRYYHSIPLPVYPSDPEIQQLPYLVRFIYTIPTMFLALRKVVCLFQFRRALGFVELNLMRCLPSYTGQQL